jgi:hypothetical protein
VAFDFEAFARFMYKSLFRSRGTNYRLTPKRAGLLLVAFILYWLVELMTWLGLWLDEILFPAYR